MAEVMTVLPYVGGIDYGKDGSKSIKDKALLVGAYASVGTLDYLVEFGYSNINATYKDSTLKNLSQDDFFLAYSKYYEKFMFKIATHHVSTTDVELGDANVLIASLGGYNLFGYDKLSYGLDGYYSYYSKGHDEGYAALKPISVVQFTPYLSFYKAINFNWGNTLLLKANYQITSDFLKDNYTSFEISDTIHYSSLFVTLRAYGGEMKTGVKDGGATVFNTLDLMKTGYGLKLGYFLSGGLVATLSYDANVYREYDENGVTTGTPTITQDAQNAVALVSLSYSF